MRSRAVRVDQLQLLDGGAIDADDHLAVEHVAFGKGSRRPKHFSDQRCLA
jgi:hypothetical protein